MNNPLTTCASFIDELVDIESPDCSSRETSHGPGPGNPATSQTTMDCTVFDDGCAGASADGPNCIYSLDLFDVSSNVSM
jgi:hypothetical protein